MRGETSRIPALTRNRMFSGEPGHLRTNDPALLAVAELDDGAHRHSLWVSRSRREGHR